MDLRTSGRVEKDISKSNEKRARVAILTSDKIGIKSKTTARNKEGYYMLMKGSIQSAITSMNTLKQIWGIKNIWRYRDRIEKRETDNSTMTAGDFSTPFSIMDSNYKEDQ